MSKMMESTDMVVVFMTFLSSQAGTYMTALRGKNSDLRDPSPPPLPPSPVAIVWCIELFENKLSEFLVFLDVVHDVKFLEGERFDDGVDS